MNQSRMLACAVAAAAVMSMALGTSASATTLTSPAGTSYTGTVKATAEDFQVIESFAALPCGHSAFEFKVEQHGASATVLGQVSNLTYSKCTFPMTVKRPGKFEIHSGGTVTWTGAEIVQHSNVGECIFTTQSTTVGTLTGGSTARLDFNATMPRTGGSFVCGNSKVFKGTYIVSSPAPLLVD